MLTMRELRPTNRNARYKLKEIDAPPDAVRLGLPAEWVLQTIEAAHEDGWVVCGVSMAGNGHGLWIFYRREGTLN